MTVALPITREKILDTARKLPAAPQVLGGLSELLQDANADLDQISHQISLDVALASRVIRISNSPVYGGSHIGSVDEAVGRVGFGEVLRLVGIATVAGLVDRELPCYRLDAEQLRESLLMHALASEALAPAMGFDPRAAYTCGLLRGLGFLVVDRIARTRLSAEDFFDGRRFSGGYAEWEGSQFGLGHTEVTTLVLSEWRFAPELVVGIREHQLVRASSFDDRFACLLNVAGAIVSDAGFALPGERAHWTLTPEKFAAAGLDEESVCRAGSEARGHFTRQRAALY
jgi:HD-like signal output (HDOD) protein